MQYLLVTINSYDWYCELFFGVKAIMLSYLTDKLMNIKQMINANFNSTYLNFLHSDDIMWLSMYKQIGNIIF